MKMNPAMEEEANYFARCLLLPEDMLRKHAAGIDLTDDKAVLRLAKKFEVPVGVLAQRLAELRK